MGNLGGVFRVSEHEESALPTDVYRVVMVSSGRVPLKSGKGSRLGFTLQVVRGPHKGRQIYDGWNLWHEDESVRKIAERQLAEYGKACGKEEFTDTSELHAIQVDAKVKHVDGDRGPRNSVGSVRKVQDAPGVAGYTTPEATARNGASAYAASRPPILGPEDDEIPF